MSSATGPVKASLFVTCIVDQFYPEVGESTVRLLRRLGVEVDFPPGQTCCGQPAFNAGFWKDAQRVARRSLRAFQDSQYIVVPSGSCASMVRVFYEELFHDDPALAQQARAIAPRVYELSQFIVDVLGVKDLGAALGRDKAAGEPRRVTYHEACHLRRELGAIWQPRLLIRSAPGVELVEMEQADVCCGFGGTFSVKYPDISGAMLQDKLNSIRATGASAVVACDCSCLMHIGGGLEKQGIPVRPVHLAQLLDEATSA